MAMWAVDLADIVFSFETHCFITVLMMGRNISAACILCPIAHIFLYHNTFFFIEYEVQKIANGSTVKLITVLNTIT